MAGILKELSIQAIKRFTFIAFFLSAVSFGLSDANANGMHVKKPKSTLTKFGEWYLLEDTRNDSCYIYTKSLKARAERDLVDDAYFYVKKVGYDAYTVGVMPGELIKKGSPLKIEIDRRGYSIKTPFYSNGITYSDRQDITVINALIKANEEYFRTKSVFIDGAHVTHYYSLHKFMKAFKMLSKKC